MNESELPGSDEHQESHASAPEGDDGNEGEAVETQVRRAFGGELEAVDDLHEFGASCFYEWHGRPVDPDSADAIVLAEGARATKTLGGVLRLASGGYGQQGAMLTRSLFEGMALAHWAHANPEEATRRLDQHRRHSAALWREALENAEPGVSLPGEPISQDERKALDEVFGRYGTRLWSAHSGLRALLPDIEHLWTDAKARDQLWWFWRIVHRDNNQVLHSTAGALSTTASRSDESVVLDAGPSELYLDRALLGATWCYLQTISLVWDHFQLPERERVDRMSVRTLEAFGELSTREPEEPAA